MKKTIIAIVVVILVAVGAYFLLPWPSNTVVQPGNTDSDGRSNGGQASTTPEDDGTEKGELVIGTSVEGRDITAYNFGTGETRLLFVGGIHGGYSWNTALVAYEMLDYLRANPDMVPSNVTVTIIPVLNPDGLNKVVDVNGKFAVSDITATQAVQVTGRFNANNVDLNRNFDCDWQSSGKWQSRTVSGGTEAFSEPETLAMKQYVESHNPAAVVVWYSSAGGVYSSSCHSGVLDETNVLTNIFAKASGYPPYESFDFYETTGDMVNWLAKMKIPAISVLLSTHTSAEWSKNKAGIDAVLSHYGE